MNLAQYDFNLPDELIAQTPAQPRDHARLLVYKLRDGSIKDSIFYKLPEFLAPSTTVVVNNSKVETCRWLFGEGKLELFILEKLDSHTVRALVRPGRKFKNGSMVQLTEWLQAEVRGVDTEGIRTLRLSVPHDDSRLKFYEHIPLPPYISQNDKLASDYQSHVGIYA